MTPFEYEQFLKQLPNEKREKMEIYTVKKDINYADPNQLLIDFGNKI